MRYVMLLCLLLGCMTVQAQNCDELLRHTGKRMESLPIPVYIHVEGVCPDDTLLLIAVCDEDKTYLTAMPSECRTPVCEYIIRKSRYEICFADSSRYFYEEPYLTDYSSDELFIMLTGRVMTRGFHPKTYKAQNKYTYASYNLADKMLHIPITAIQVYNAIPRTGWEGQPYKLEYTPGSRLLLSPQAAARLVQALQCLLP